MSYTIRLTPPELKQKAAQIDDNAEIVAKEMRELRNLLGGLQTTFLGELASPFFKEFDEISQSMEQWDDIVRSFSFEIRDVANKLEKADKSFR